MKRILSILLCLSLLAACMPRLCAAAAQVEGWSAYADDFTGWTVCADGISGAYDEVASSYLSRDCLTDVKNFVLEADICGDAQSSPYLSVLNNVIELGGNNGSGDQVYVKIADDAKGWMNATGTRVHVKLMRVDGGELMIRLEGAGNDTPAIYTAAVRSKDSSIKFGVYRGRITVENLLVRAPEADDEADFAVEKLAPPDPSSYNQNVNTISPDTYFEYDAQAAWQLGQSDTQGLYLLSEPTQSEAVAVYVREKLPVGWLVNCAIAPEQGGQGEVVLMDAAQSIAVRVGVAYADGVLRLYAQTAPDGDQTVLAELPAAEYTDRCLNLRLQQSQQDTISLSVLGDAGYQTGCILDLPQGTAQTLSLAGVTARGSAVRFENFRVGSVASETDYEALAKQTYANLMKNYLDTENDRLYQVFWGYINGTVTNTGKTVSFGGGSVWEMAVMLMALDTYASTLPRDGSEYREVAQIIANSVMLMTQVYPENMFTTAAETPNWAMDDAGWNTIFLLLGYHYSTFLGNDADAALCLRYAKALFNSCYDVFYKSDAGGLVYSTTNNGVDLYGSTTALAGYFLDKLDPDEQIHTRYLQIYDAIEDYLRRPDGLYWINSEEATTRDYGAAPYSIREAGSVTYLNGNLAMTVLNTLLGNTEKARETIAGILRYETYDNGAFLNDRDAWNNTFFLGLFVRFVMSDPELNDGRLDRALSSTVSMILQNACFDDGYYGASWSGPREPSSIGYTEDYPVEERNRWGRGLINDGLNIGSAPQQIMTSATTAHVLLAAALNRQCGLSGAKLSALSVNGQQLWPVFNPDIRQYTLLGTSDAAVTIEFAADNGAVVTVNGAVVTDRFTAAGGRVELCVTSGDGKSSTTYVLQLGDAPQKADYTMYVCIGVIVLCAAAVAVALVPRKKK